MRKSILLVDDDEEIIDCYRLVLENEYSNLYLACNAAEAMNILKEVKIDIAVLDYMLPNCRGDKLAQRINESYPNVVIFVVSGVFYVDEVFDGKGVQVKKVFKKPVDPDVLENSIFNEGQIDVTRSSD